MSNATMSLTLPSGLKLEGSVDDVLNTAKLLGHDVITEGKYYYSDSKKRYIKVGDMPDAYCRNAFSKLLQVCVSEYVTSTKSMTNIDFVKAYVEFGNRVLGDNKLLMNMLFHLRNLEEKKADWVASC